MPTAAPGLRRRFLGWDGVWLPRVAAWLAEGWSSDGALDLSRTLALVPTRQAGRRLREALAEHAAARGAAVFPPRTQTPDTLLGAGSAAAGVASRLEATLAWTEVLRAADLDGCRAVFPTEPPARDFAWAWRLAETFSRLQTQLMEGGLDFADVARRVGPDFAEAERWTQLAALEAVQRAKLAAVGRREPHAARRDWADTAAVPAGIERIVVLAVTDPLPLAVEVLRRWAATMPVEVAIAAPAEEEAAFDDVGRPDGAAWARRVLRWPDFAGQVHLCAEPAAEAEQAVAIARRHADPDGVVALGVADPEALPVLENGLSRAGLAGYNPEGRPRRAERLHGLLAAIAALARAPTAATAVGALARCPDFLDALQARAGGEFSIARLLAELDAAQAERLPADLPALRRAVTARTPRLAAGLALVDAVRATLDGADFASGAIAAPALLLGGRRLDLAAADDARLAEELGAWRDTVRECAAAAERFPRVRAADWWEVALRAFGESRRTEAKRPGALELQGWLELLWEDAPHLVIAGLNDGLVPEAIVGDAFLPESLREQIGLKTNAARFARDACLLQALVAARAERGRLDVLLAKTSAARDPLRPSRLLLLCADEELPGRVAALFREAPPGRPNLPWRRAWTLAPGPVVPPAKVAVTGLRAWLACPFRFYLQHVRRMEAVDAAKSELDARDFGTLCHAALEAMAREPALRDCTDEAVLREFLLDAIEREARGRFGDERTLPLTIQMESARQRLSRFAAVQARERAEGWVIVEVERPFALALGGLEVRGRIDRIDRHEAHGAWRVLDYKTSDTAVAPQRSHLRSARGDDATRPAWQRVGFDGRECVWTDLQLPLYLHALAPTHPTLQAGYVNLPKAAGETAVVLWPDFTPEMLAAARACAEGVAAAIAAGEFWPPAELPADRDAFGSLFHHGAADSVAWPTAEGSR